ncbi:MAG: hypothetical protein WC700_02105 [Gemmatimonadaceae bacterium]|jgi:hypothetical protein
MSEQPSALILPFRRIVAIHGALTQLANRRLPGIQNDLRVARRLDLIKTEVAAYEKRRKEIIKEHTSTDDAGEEKLVRPMELQGKLDALLEEVCDIKPPKTKLTEADLPKAMKGMINAGNGRDTIDGDSNAAGLGAIVADLAPEFFAVADEPEE